MPDHPMCPSVQGICSTAFARCILGGSLVSSCILSSATVETRLQPQAVMNSCPSVQGILKHGFARWKRILDDDEIGLKPTLAAELEAKDRADQHRAAGQPQMQAARDANLLEVAAAEAALKDDSATPAAKVHMDRTSP